jgi:hypothetical protein
VASAHPYILLSLDLCPLCCTLRRSYDRTCGGGGAGGQSPPGQASCEDGGGDVYADTPSSQ